MKSNVKIISELIAAQNYIYDQLGIKYSNLQQESESEDYGACRFEINNQKVLFRIAKITPTKIGQFVTIWKRINKSPIIPFDSSDFIDLVIISVSQGELRGHFVFPKEILIEKNIFSHNNKGGKRAIRVYPPWDRAENSQAKTTQCWQLKYFFAFGPEIQLNKQKVKLLLNLSNN